MLCKSLPQGSLSVTLHFKENRYFAIGETWEGEQFEASHQDPLLAVTNLIKFITKDPTQPIFHYAKILSCLNPPTSFDKSLLNLLIQC